MTAVVTSDGSSTNAPPPNAPTPSVKRLALSLGALVAIGPFAIDTYLPALPAMAEDFSSTTAAVERSVSLYLIGAAIGQLFAGPISDKYGRSTVATVGLTVFALASIAISMINSVWMLDILRVTQALGGGVTVITSGATVRDHFQGREAAKMITSIGLVMLIAPLIAPAVGTLLVHLGGWRLIFVMLAAYALLLMGIVRYALPKTSAARAAVIDTSGLMHRWKRVLSYRPGAALIICNGFCFSAFFAFITDSAFLYLEFYQVDKNWFPILFGANVVAMLACNRLNAVLLHHYDSHTIMLSGLVGIWIGGAVLLGQFLFFGKPPLATVVPNLMFVGGLVALTMPNGIASLLHLFPKDAGTASGLSGAGQFMIAGSCGVLISIFHNHTPIPMALVIFVSATIALLARLYGGAKHDMAEQAPGQEF